MNWIKSLNNKFKKTKTNSSYSASVFSISLVILAFFCGYFFRSPFIDSNNSSVDLLILSQKIFTGIASRCNDAQSAQDVYVSQNRVSWLMKTFLTRTNPKMGCYITQLSRLWTLSTKIICFRYRGTYFFDKISNLKISILPPKWLYHFITLPI